MPAPYNPPWGRGSSGQRSTPDPNMRVSHAERTEVADRLSKHYGDGRLDEEEFNERLDKAMKAKTRADLDGLFDDLPGGPGEAPRPQAGPPAKPAIRPPRRRSSLPRIALLAFVAIVAIMVGQSLAGPLFAFPFQVIRPFGWGLHIPWLLVGLAVFLWWRFARRRP